MWQTDLGSGWRRWRERCKRRRKLIPLRKSARSFYSSYKDSSWNSLPVNLSVKFFIKHLRLVYKPHSVQWTPLRGPLVQSSLWARCHHLARCSLPGTGLSHKRKRHMRRRAVSHRPQTISSLLGLAPGGGYLATRITARAGGLLHHLFTITLIPKDGGLFVSVALIRQVTPFSVFPSTRDGVSPPRVLSDAVLYRSADFPRSRQRRTATARPA